MTLFSVFASACLPSEPETRYRFVVAATSADRNEPVLDANVSIVYLGKKREFGISGALRQKEKTDGDGKAYLVYYDEGEYKVTVEHQDYETMEQIEPVTGRSRDVNLLFSLKRKAENKLVVVSLIAADNKQPVVDAKIYLQGSTFTALYTGTTDSAGRALINVVEGGTYDVQITHSLFQSINATLSVKGFDDEQKEYALSYEMQRKNASEEEERTLIVTLQGKDKDGNVVPVKDANVNLPDGQSKLTGPDGTVEFKHKFPPGGTVNVNIGETKGYQAKSDSFMVSTIGADFLTVMLEKRDCTMPSVEGSYTLTGDPSGLLVIDSHSGNQVSGRYGEDAGSLVNTIEGTFLTGDQCNVLSGTFTNNEHNTSGQFTYHFSNDGVLFAGTWLDNAGYSGNWDGTQR
jgi:hypothetical protein